MFPLVNLYVHQSEVAQFYWDTTCVDPKLNKTWQSSRYNVVQQEWLQEVRYIIEL